MNDFARCLVVLALWVVLPMIAFGFFRTSSGATGGRKQKTEQGYLIRNKRTQYPMTVGKDALDKALATGDYKYEGPATYETAGGFYDTSNNYVQGGHIPAGRNYQDERLN